MTFRLNRTALVTVAWAAVLFLSSAAAIGLLAVRVERTGSWQWSFLVFNLALSWIPLAFASVVALLIRLRASKWTIVAPALAWLVFLPNSPYIWTDLIHLSNHRREFFVTDFVLISSFALAGLLAGYASLYLTQDAIERSFGRAAGWLLVAGALPLTSVGIYIGRVLRWNSWQSFEKADELLSLAAARAAHPLDSPRPVAACLLMTLCLAAGYAVAFALTRVALTYPARRTSPR